MYSIIGIDGIDGSGKSTVTQFVKERLIMMGYKVITIEPPFYDTVSGSLVTDYLRNGYGDIRDRYICTSLLFDLGLLEDAANYFKQVLDS